MKRVMPTRDRIGGNKYSTLRQRLVSVQVGPLVRTRRDPIRKDQIVVLESGYRGWTAAASVGDGELIQLKEERERLAVVHCGGDGLPLASSPSGW